jgi:diguanylate cyclase (GGDEF)-like protein
MPIFLLLYLVSSQNTKDPSSFFMYFIPISVAFGLVTAWNFKLLKEIRQKKENFFKMAHYDILTGLPNRLMFMNAMESLSGRGCCEFSVMYIDLDRFKIYNDTYGHGFGDKVLTKMAEALIGSVRDGTDIYRIGGDEFVVIIKKVSNRKSISEIANRILKKINQPIFIDGVEITLSCSIGISSYPDDGDNVTDLLKKADMAMYDSKESGKNTYSYFDSPLQDKVNQISDIQNTFRESLRNGNLFPVFQPQVDSETNAIVGVEVLSRWYHPQKGQIPPSQFIPVLEESGEIVHLTEQLIRTAARIIRANDLHVPISVNVSAAHLKRRDNDLVKLIHDVTTTYNVDPSLIELEFTEGVLIHYTEEVEQKLKTLSGMGVKLALDDFGTGYSSLSYLQKFPIDTIKIDRAFVSSIGSKDTILLNTIIAMGESLGKDLIAEGVEDQQQVSYLREKGCTVCQGFYFYKPMSEQELIAVLA